MKEQNFRGAGGRGKKQSGAWQGRRDAGLQSQGGSRHGAWQGGSRQSDSKQRGSRQQGAWQNEPRREARREFNRDQRQFNGEARGFNSDERRGFKRERGDFKRGDFNRGDFKRGKRTDFSRDERRAGGFKRDERAGGGDFNRGDSNRGDFNRGDFKRGWFDRDERRGFKRGKRADFNRDDAKRDGVKQAGQRQEFGRGGTRGGGRSDRGGREREYTAAERIAHELRPVRQPHTDPEIPESVQANMLQPGARNELKTLEKDNADRVAKHLVMVRELIHIDPELAHQHAISASRRAGRIPVARETLAATAYALGDYAMALREYRTWRRLTGRNDHIAFMVDCERGLERPAKALEIAAEVDPLTLPQEARVLLAIAVSGARLDLGQPEQARAELEIPQLNPRKAYPFSPLLFRAYAAVLEELQDSAAAANWEKLADRAEAALTELHGGDELLVTDAMASAEELAARGIEIDAAADSAPEAVVADSAVADSTAADSTAGAKEHN